jgi:hypothetical protein
VTLTNDVAQPSLVDRRTIDLGDDTFSRFVYHDARDRSFADAQQFVKRCETAVVKYARTRVGALLRELERRDVRVVGGAIVDADKPFGSPGLERVLASHSLTHGAEGDLYRSAMRDGFARHGVDLEPIPRRDLAARAGPVDAAVTALGRAAGPPWRREHKDASLAALAAAALMV